MVGVIIAAVGLTGSGKSEATRLLKEKGFFGIRFGDLTDEEIEKNGLEINEKNERAVREGLRKHHGMAAYAKLNIPKIDKAVETSDVVIDGLYSWEEYLVLKDKYGDKLIILAVYASPKTRYARLKNRKIRPLTEEESKSRDYSEIENLKKGGPIAIADFTIVNEGTLEKLEKHLNHVLEGIK